MDGSLEKSVSHERKPQILGFAPNDPKRRLEWRGIPPKPKPGLNGVPSLSRGGVDRTDRSPH